MPFLLEQFHVEDSWFYLRIFFLILHIHTLPDSVAF